MLWNFIEDGSFDFKPVFDKALFRNGSDTEEITDWMHFDLDNFWFHTLNDEEIIDDITRTFINRGEEVDDGVGEENIEIG